MVVSDTNKPREASTFLPRSRQRHSEWRSDQLMQCERCAHNHPFDALNACLHRACRDAQDRPVRRAHRSRSGLSPFTHSTRSTLAQGRPFTFHQSPITICFLSLAKRCLSPSSLCVFAPLREIFLRLFCVFCAICGYSRFPRWRASVETSLPEQ